VFRNRGNLSFEDVSSKAGPSFQVPAPHRGAAFGDLNNDGKIDAIVIVLNGLPEIWMNHSNDHNHWIILNLSVSNPIVTVWERGQDQDQSRLAVQRGNNCRQL